MIRAFLALDISNEVKKNLGAFIEPFKTKTEGVKWVEPQNLHVTLKFFGNIDETKMLKPIQEIVERNCASIGPVSLVCEGVGAFPKWQSPRVIWAGLKGEAQSLIDLQKNLEESFEELGFPKENRELKLHLTLARIKGLSGDKTWLKTLEGMPAKVFGEVTVNHLTLYKSVLTKPGPIYTPIKRFDFSS